MWNKMELMKQYKQSFRIVSNGFKYKIQNQHKNIKQGGTI